MPEKFKNIEWPIHKDMMDSKLGQLLHPCMSYIDDGPDTPY